MKPIESLVLAIVVANCALLFLGAYETSKSLDAIDRRIDQIAAKVDSTTTRLEASIAHNQEMILLSSQVIQLHTDLLETAATQHGELVKLAGRIQSLVAKLHGLQPDSATVTNHSSWKIFEGYYDDHYFTPYYNE